MLRCSLINYFPQSRRQLRLGRRNSPGNRRLGLPSIPKPRAGGPADVPAVHAPWPWRHGRRFWPEVRSWMKRDFSRGNLFLADAMAEFGSPQNFLFEYGVGHRYEAQHPASPRRKTGAKLGQPRFARQSIRGSFHQHDRQCSAAPARRPTPDAAITGELESVGSLTDPGPLTGRIADTPPDNHDCTAGHNSVTQRHPLEVCPIVTARPRDVHPAQHQTARGAAAPPK